ncbi:radical SAM protein [Candidatus Kuenenbacteria bacterium]|nr:radical SAM protein [Candidatus Kuenenbacteria bacterium]
MQEGQFEFLSMCDGQHLSEDIFQLFDKESCGVVRMFYDELIQKGVIDVATSPRLRSLPDKLPPNPGLQFVHLEVRGSCNLKCAHCYQGDRYYKSDALTLVEIERLADEMQELLVQGVSVSGGEPFFQDDLFQMMQLFEERDIRVISVFTNATLLTEKKIKNILKMRSRPTIFVSLDSITAAGMQFRGLALAEANKALGAILNNVKMLVASGISVVINTVMNQLNIDALPAMYNVVKNLGITSWRIGYPKEMGYFKSGGVGTFGVPWSEMTNAAFSLLQHHFDEGRPFHLQLEYLYREELFGNLQALSDKDFVCDYEEKRGTCCIKPNGDVVSCAYCADFPIGNVRTDSLAKIWYSPNMQKIKEIRIGDVKECNGCEVRKYCATGCRANAYFLHGDFYNSRDDYACQAVKFFVETVKPFLQKQGISL